MSAAAGEAACELSVIVPVYNEAATIERLVAELGEEADRLVSRFEVIVVDDASTDETPRILGRLAADRPWLDVRRSPLNAGHGPSVVRGLDLASAEWVFQIDSDGQFVVPDLARLWELRAELDLALGIRAQRKDPLHRLVLSRVVGLASSLLAGRRLRDANTPFRLLRRSVWAELRPLIDAGTLAPNVFVSVGASVRGRRVAEVPVTHLPRERGTASLRSLRLVRFSLRGLGQLVVFRYRLARMRPSLPAAAGSLP